MNRNSEVYSSLMDEGFKTSVEKVTADVVEVARELELDVEHEYRNTLLQSHDKTLTDEELLLMDEWRKWFVGMKSTSGEDEKIAAMTENYLVCHINLIHKAGAGFERIDSNFKSVRVGG